MRRRTAAKLIAAAESCEKRDTWPARAVATFVAMYGRMPDQGEITTSSFYIAFSELQMSLKNRSNNPLSAEDRKLLADVKYFEKELCRNLMRAVREFRAESLYQFANSVAFFRGFFGPGKRRIPAVDGERLALLLLKYELAEKRQKWTVRQVAKYLYGNSEVEKLAEDGFSKLRRKCKELNFMLAAEASKKSKGNKRPSTT